MFTLQIIALLAAIPVIYAIVHFLRERFLQPHIDELESDFQQEWSGRPEDEIQAWYRVRLKYMYRNSNKKYLQQIDKAIASLNKERMISDFVVNQDGEILSAFEEQEFDLNS